MQETKVSVEITAGKTMEISTGKIAHLANGSCVVRQGDTCVLAAVCSGPARKGSDSSNAKDAPPTRKFSLCA